MKWNNLDGDDVTDCIFHRYLFVLQLRQDILSGK